jgi:hypothetical protein
MELKQGDCVRTETGEVGKIVFIDRLTAFVSFTTPGKQHDIRAFLLSTLTLDEPGKDSDEGAPPEDSA